MRSSIKALAMLSILGSLATANASGDVQKSWERLFDSAKKLDMSRFFPEKSCYSNFRKGSSAQHPYSALMLDFSGPAAPKAAANAFSLTSRRGGYATLPGRDNDHSAYLLAGIARETSPLIEENGDVVSYHQDNGVQVRRTYRQIEDGSGRVTQILVKLDMIDKKGATNVVDLAFDAKADEKRCTGRHYETSLKERPSTTIEELFQQWKSARHPQPEDLLDGRIWVCGAYEWDADRKKRLEFMHGELKELYQKKAREAFEKGRIKKEMLDKPFPFGGDDVSETFTFKVDGKRVKLVDEPLAIPEVQFNKDGSLVGIDWVFLGKYAIFRVTAAGDLIVARSTWIGEKHHLYRMELCPRGKTIPAVALPPIMNR